MISLRVYYILSAMVMTISFAMPDPEPDPNSNFRIKFKQDIEIVPGDVGQGDDKNGGQGNGQLCHDCNHNCGTELDPTCGTDNQNYPNPCWLRFAACQVPEEHIEIQYYGECRADNGTLDGDCDDDCDIEADPVCGTNEKTYLNECWLDYASCQEPEQNVELKYYGECEDNGTHCEDDCGIAVQPVCGSNDKTYPNPCWLYFADCQTPDEHIVISHEGECRVSRRTTVCTPLSSRSGNLTYPMDGFNYTNTQDICWVIVTPGSSIRIEFTHFDTEPDYDFVIISDGISSSAQLLASFSGSTVPETIRTTENQAIIRFTSDSSVTKTGFSLSWSTVGSSASSACDAFNADSGSFIYPQDSSNYNNNVDVCWVIVTSGAILGIDFNSFHTESRYDPVFIRDGSDKSAPLLGEYSGDAIPATVQTTSDKAYIHFKSDFSINFTGFALNWKTLGNSGCKLFTDDSGSFNLTRDGSNYLNNQDLCWVIETSGPIIEIEFTHFDIEARFDFVKIRDGNDKSAPLLATYTGNGVQTTTRTTSNIAFIRFTSDYFLSKTGFTLRWNTLGPDSSCSCGTVNRNRIVGGTEVESPRKYPWMVLVESYAGGNTYNCGGSIINDRYILTAAHCFYSSPKGKPCFYEQPTNINVYIGEHELHNDNEDDPDNTRQISVKSHIIHPEYNCQNSQNDFALLMLNENIKFNDVIRPVCLPEDDSKTYENEIATATGWGATSAGGASSNVLLEVELPILDTHCGGYEDITYQMLCAGYPETGGKDTCQGDSGGPLTVIEDGKYVQIGVVSYGKGCAKIGNVGVYARVSTALDWIHSMTAAGEFCN